MGAGKSPDGAVEHPFLSPLATACLIAGGVDHGGLGAFVLPGFFQSWHHGLRSLAGDTGHAEKAFYPEILSRVLHSFWDSGTDDLAVFPEP